MTTLFALIFTSVFANAAGKIDCRSWEKSVIPKGATNISRPQNADLRVNRRSLHLIDVFLSENGVGEMDLNQKGSCAIAYNWPRLRQIVNWETVIQSKRLYEMNSDIGRCKIQVSLMLLDGYNEELIQGTCKKVILATPVIYYGSALGALKPAGMP